jgi:VWFA-related protein
MSNGLLRARPLACLAVLLASAAAAPAQKDPKTTVKETASATIIEVPVNVIGRDGKPVAGLTADDFELYDEGKKQPISGFEVVYLQKTAAPAAKPEAALEIPPSARRLWLIVFDLSYTSPSGLLRAKDGARSFVTNSMKSDDLAAVGTLSVETGWKLLVNFTRDRQQLARAIETLGLPGFAMRTTDPLAFAFGPPNPSGSPSGGTATDSKMSSDVKDLQTLQKTANDDLARGRVANLVNSLAGIGRVLDSVRGRKHVLFFSEGFETRLLSGNASGGDRGSSLQQTTGSSLAATSPQDAADATVSGEIWKIDSDARFGSSSMRNRLTAALSGFKRSDAVLDTIDIGGLRAEGGVEGDTRGKPGSGTDALFTMASETDGDFVRNANQLGGELERVSERTALVYLLAYQPQQLTKPGAFHALKVKVKAPGAKVIARSGYYEPRPYRSLSPLERLLASGDLVTGGSRENAFPVQILAAPFAGQGGIAQVPVVLEIPGRPLLTGDAGPKTGIQIFAYATDESGKLWDYASQEITLDLERVRPTIEAGGLKFLGTLSLPVGDYAVRTLVRNASTGNSAVATARVRVAEIPGPTPVVLAPFFQEPAGRWTMVKAGPRADAPARATEYPFSVGGDSFIPSALPVLVRGAPAQVQVTVMTFNFGASERVEPLQLLAEILGSDGKPRKVDVQIVRRSDKEPNGARAALLSFKPAELEPGRYLFKVRVSDRVSQRTAEASTAFEVRSP